jgi:hypothetical protein
MIRVERVTFTVVDLADRVKILDASGQTVAMVDKGVACAMPQAEEKRLELALQWQKRLQLLAWNFTSRVKRKGENKWSKKCTVWLRSLRWRRNRKRHLRKSNALTGVVRESGLEWEATCRLLLSQYAYRYYEKRKRVEQPWRLWAQTVYSNLNKRKDIRNERLQDNAFEARWQGHNQRPHANRRASGFQVCFDWYRDHSETVVA